MIGGHRKSASRLAIAAAAGLFVGGLALSPAKAADLGGDCCADLEERVAELEATTARKGNRVVSLTVYGQVNKALLYWNDANTHGHRGGTGDSSDVYVVDNANSGSRFGFRGSANIGNGWSAGYRIEIGITDESSAGVNGNNGNGAGDDVGHGVNLRHNFVWIRGSIGTISLGHTSTTNDGIAYSDLSGAAVVAGPDGNAWSAGFGHMTTTALNSGRMDIIRYDSPTFAGFSVSASWGEDDYWDVALRYANQFANTLRIAAGIGYASDTEPGNLDSARNTTQISGSIALLHIPTGLNIMFAAGERSDASATTRNPNFWYIKGGVNNRFFALGNTALYGEYGRYNNMNAMWAATTNSVQVWGVGIVQNIDAAAMQLYLGYRNYDNNVAGDTNMHTIAAGARIQF